MSNPKYMRIRNSRNPEDYYVWTPQLASNQDLEPYDGELPPRLPKRGQSADEVPVAESPPVIQSALEQLQAMAGVAAEDIIPEKQLDDLMGESAAVAQFDAGRIAAIRAVIPALNPVDDWSKPASWNNFISIPKVDPVSKAVGFKLSQEEIKEAVKEETPEV